jgi:Fe2+ or Zn2+ uptake regulation protein
MSHDAIDLPTLVRERGARLTPQRQIILDTLCALGGHVTVAEVYEQVHGRFPAIDRSTVYRALAFFDELGLVVASEAGGVAVYEIAPAGSAAHQHLICRDCGGVEHVHGAVFDDLARQLARTYGFVADLDRLTIEGLCRDCAAEKR